MTSRAVCNATVWDLWAANLTAPLPLPRPEGRSPERVEKERTHLGQGVCVGGPRGAWRGQLRGHLRQQGRGHRQGRRRWLLHAWRGGGAPHWGRGGRHRGLRRSPQGGHAAPARRHLQRPVQGYEGTGQARSNERRLSQRQQTSSCRPTKQACASRISGQEPKKIYSSFYVNYLQLDIFARQRNQPDISYEQL